MQGDGCTPVSRSDVILPAMAAGHVIVIGGAEDKVRERVILNRFIKLAGGRDARIAVISTASSLGPLAGEMYRRVFGELGAAEVHPIHTVTRAQANDAENARIVRDATGIFMTGGNQLRLSSTIGGTALAQQVVRRHREGAVVAGTSAGASAMSTHMVAFGASGSTPKQRMVQMAAGLGILPGVIVDQHFEARNRLGRLLAIIASNPSLLGIGVDEDTAGVVGPDGVMEVIGRRSVTILDGAESETDAWEVKAHKPVMISGVVLHSLPSGYRFDLERRERVAAPMLRALEPNKVASS
jgi:cyanophycinase